ncbi:hypothetical protein BX591_11052 [Paraburkholderia bryophila]|uniref:Uncharacterized protein n=1 Tax=Paraburkholderia bryophila TaxID=420952 RepID=A0A329C6N2_9BURK|nr:hypothetical protein BX591_11052 [Paraburkholderia bryophila]
MHKPAPAASTRCPHVDIKLLRELDTTLVNEVH